LRAIRNGPIEDDVGELDPAARAEDPEALGKRDRLVRHEVENAVRDDHVGPAVWGWECLEDSLTEFDVA